MTGVKSYRINNALKGRTNIERLVEMYVEGVLKVEMIKTNNHTITVNWDLLKVIGYTDYKNMVDLFESWNIFERAV